MKTKLNLIFIAAYVLSSVCANTVNAKTYDKATIDKPYTICFIGDSITFEPSYATVIGQYPNISVKTDAIGATQVAGKSNPESFVNRTKGKKYGTDLIMIMGGTNDYLGMNSMCNSLGTISDKDTNTFCGAYNVMIKNIKANNLKSTIVLITPIKRAGYSDLNIYGYSLTDYVNAVKMIAANNKIGCIDLYNNKECDFVTSHFMLSGSKMHLDSADYDCSSLVKSNEFFSDGGLHPSQEGHKVIGNTLIKYIVGF